MNLAAQFIRATLGEAPRPGWAAVQDWPAGGGGSKVAAFAPDTPAEQIGRYVEARDRAGRDVYVRTSLTAAYPGPGRRGGKDESAGLNVLPLDLDGVWGRHGADPATLWPDLDTAVRFVGELRRRGIPMTALVDTGGGVHGFGAVRGLETCGPDEAAAVLCRWGLLVNAAAAEFGPWRADPVYNSDRILRPPGTGSKKYTPGRPVRLISTGPPIGADVLLPLLPNLPAPPPEPARLLVPRPATTCDGEARPGDAYNEATTWEDDLLVPAGWVRLFDRGETTYWRHPNASNPMSATTNHGGTDRLAVFSNSTPFDSVLETKRTYDRFGAFAVLNHGGDLAAAAKALAAQGYGARTDDVTRLAEFGTFVRVGDPARPAGAVGGRLWWAVQQVAGWPDAEAAVNDLIRAAVAGGLSLGDAARTAVRARHQTAKAA